MERQQTRKDILILIRNVLFSRNIGAALKHFTPFWVKQHVTREFDRENNVQGRVMIMFYVEINGNIKNLKLIEGVSATINDEALRVVQSTSGSWQGGQMYGRPMEMFYISPITFTLRTW
jgi:hypothetical protein